MIPKDKTQLHTFSLPVESGWRFCLFHEPPPARACRGTVLYVHPFAEELNKSRRAVAVAARRFAAMGFCVLQIDLAGCGDSSGELSDATWSLWLQDLERAAAWLAERDRPVTVIWGLRLGAMLAASAVGRIAGSEVDLLLWQPVTSGRAHTTQFLRLRSAAEMLAGTNEPASTPAARSTLKAGNRVSVAGYDLAPALVESIDAQETALPSAFTGRILWLEARMKDTAGLSPASVRSIEGLRSAGHDVTARALSGSPFWQTVEIEESPGLTEASLAWLIDATPRIT